MVHLIVKVVFYLSIIEITYAYLGYPLSLWFLSKLRGHHKEAKKNIYGNNYPDVSFIIAAYNEANKIEEKIRNTLSLEYDRDKLEIIIASDCSTDGTDDIVKSYADEGISLVRTAERRGKENAQKVALRHVRGKILVFSDTGTMLQPDAIKNMVSNFADPSVGCVSSIDKFIDPDGCLSGEGAYVRYEMFLRKLESKVNTLVGLSGSFFSARREVCENWATDLQSDFNTLLNSVKCGMRGVLDPQSVGFYRNIADPKKEFDRKVRTIVRGITVFMNNLALLNVFRYGLFSWQFFSHKLCRWLVPVFLILLFVSNLIIYQESLGYALSFVSQILFYGVAIMGLLYGKQSMTWIRIPVFFVQVNASVLAAWINYLRGQRVAFWEPSQR